MKNLVSSLRFRITAIVVGLSAIILTAGSWFVLRWIEDSLVDDIKAADVAELELLAERYFDNGGSFVPSVNSPSFNSGRRWILTPGPDGTLYEVWNEGGWVIANTPFDEDSDALIPIGVRIEGVDDILEADNPELITSVIVVPSFEHKITLMARTPRTQVDASMVTIRTVVLIVVPVLVAAAGVAAWMVSKRTLQPVADIAEQAERISGSSLHERVPVPKKRDEIHSLATTMNDMLGRLESSQNRFREFVSDASHELRNPVATSIARLEATLAHPTDSDWDETVKAVLVEQQRLAALVDELLVLARLDEHNPRATTDVDLDDILLDEASRVDNVKVDTSKVKPSRVQGDRRLLQRAIRNLLDNARRYASTTIWVTTARRGGTVTLTIEDDGPGISNTDREKVFERFYRPDEARSREHGGAGLGLAIVRSVVTQSGGHVDVNTSRHGGAKFRIVFP